MMLRPTVRDSKGFTLIEILVASVIVGVIAVQGITAFYFYLKKARSVEGELALSEIKRLEDLYYNTNLRYSSSLTEIGWNPSTPPKYYSIAIQLNGSGPPPFLYQVTARGNLDDDPDLDAWVLTMDMNQVSSLRHGCIPGGVGAVQIGCAD
ncbi:MAG: prepilin-type N-terminal cleavage/methylation domain-containing protein [Nitrospirae bacterium]|nr:MAG: prepilin-type N-terminal cleavage/methylation domain-containing protein [Nitrospirota bacterium]